MGTRDEPAIKLTPIDGRGKSDRWLLIAQAPGTLPKILTRAPALAPIGFVMSTPWRSGETPRSGPGDVDISSSVRRRSDRAMIIMDGP